MPRRSRFLSGIAGLGVLISLVLTSCSATPDPWAERSGPRVLAYFPPLYSLAATIAGDDAQVQSLITHVGPHHFEPKARDVRALIRADLFLTIGLGLDDTVASKLAKAAGNASLKTIELGESLPKETLREGGCECCKRDPNHKHEHAHGDVEYDPHVWLGIDEATKIATAIGKDLAAIDPSHADGYVTRAADLNKRLLAIQVEGRKALGNEKDKLKLITFHDSLFYFARSVGFEVVDSIEAPGQEPSQKKIKQLVETCKKHGVRLIAVEPQYPTNTSAKTLLDELKRQGIDAAFVEIDPLETADPADLTPDWYERKMRENIANLIAAIK